MSREAMLELLLSMGREIRGAVVAACAAQRTEQLSAVVRDDEGDTIYAIDSVSEQIVVARVGAAAAALGGVVLVAEGLRGGQLVLPRGSSEAAAQWRLIVDPIDGTRGIMYQKRSAWVLAAAAPNQGEQTPLSAAEVTVQIEIPTLKQHLCDDLWLVAGGEVVARRVDRLSGVEAPLELGPSRAGSIAHGYAMLSRFFPGVRAELAAIDEEVVRAVLGVSPAGKALCFEDQYASTSGQLYELMAGHDRFNADLRPLFGETLERRGLPKSLCCHPYDVCTLAIAERLGVIVTDPLGQPLGVPMNVDADVAWVAYANHRIRAEVEPALRAALVRRGLVAP